MLETLLEIWEWIAASLLGIVTLVLGWLRWGKRLMSGKGDATTSELSVVRAVSGEASKELGLMISDQVKAWRLSNLVRISEKFDRICLDKKIQRNDLQALGISIGLPMLEKATYEEDDELQEMWANLMVSAMTDDSSDDIGDLYRTWTDTLSRMSKWDCRLMVTIVERGITEHTPDGFTGNPLTRDDLLTMSEIPPNRMDIHLDKLLSLGLISKEVANPFQTGDSARLEHIYVPTVLGVNLYVICGNRPKWLKDAEEQSQQ